MAKAAEERMAEMVVIESGSNSSSKNWMTDSGCALLGGELMHAIGKVSVDA